MAKETPKTDDLELKEEEAAEVKGGVFKNIHKNVLKNIHKDVNKSVNQGPGVNKT